MKRNSLWIMAAILGLFFYAASNCYAQSNVIKGTLIEILDNDLTIIAEKTNEQLTLHPTTNAKIMRGQIGKTMRNTSLTEFANGDWIVAEINNNGRAQSLKAYFGVITGNFQKSGNGNITLIDGREIKVNNQVQVILHDGSRGTIGDIEQGSRLTCRINPVSNEIWTILASKAFPVNEPEPALKVQPKKAEPEKPAEKPKTLVDLPPAGKPKVSSITFSAPNPLKAGNLITVDLTGTPAGEATVEVKTLIAPTKMNEMSSGVYRLELVVPDGKLVNDVPLIGRIKIGDQRSDPVQASRLITVVGSDTEISEQQQEEAKPATNAQVRNEIKKPLETPPPSPTQAPSVAEQTKQPEKKNDNDLVKITKPEDGQILTNVLLIEGTAKPETQVVIKVFYTNNRHGILKLSGEAANQIVGVDKSGKFKYGPIPLEGVLATKGLSFNIIANYLGAQKDAANIKATK